VAILIITITTVAHVNDLSAKKLKFLQWSVTMMC